MLKLLLLIPFVPTMAQPAPVLATPPIHQVIQSQPVRALPGQLDSVPVFNSNSPELVQTEGILLSTFPTEGMRSPQAHLNYAFDGRFDIFAHHIARGLTPDDVRTLFIAKLVHNPGDRPVQIDVHQTVSYLSQEAPFYDLPSHVLNRTGSVFAGPGSRTTTDMLRGVNQRLVPQRITLAPGSTQLLMNEPIPLRSLEAFRNGLPLPQYLPQSQLGTDLGEVMDGDTGVESQPAPPVSRELPINARTTQMYLTSNGPVHVASLAMFARLLPNGSERPPSLDEWRTLLREGNLAGPRDIAPSPPDSQRMRRFFYGRVAGVAYGSRWEATLTDTDEANTLTIPEPGEAVSFAISTVDRNTFGTGQIQSAPIAARYPDTAYRAHGNYGIHYSLSLPLTNTSSQARQVAILFQTPVKDEHLRGQALRFFNPPQDRVFYRGTLRLQYKNEWGVEQTRYIHVVQRRGQRGEPLVTLRLPAGARRDVAVDFLYPPDATPPQVLTVQTLGRDVVPSPEEGAPVLSRQPVNRAIAPEFELDIVPAATEGTEPIDLLLPLD